MPHRPLQYTDYELITFLKSGKEPAFQELFYRYENKVYLYALKLTLSREAARELTHDIFIKVWEYREKIDENMAFSSLLFRIARNHILNHLRDQGRQLALQREYTSSIEESRNSTEEAVTWQEYLQATDRAIEQLPRQRRSIFTMSRKEGKSYDEIAEALGISRNTVRIQMIKSLKFIRKYIVVYLDVPAGILPFITYFFLNIFS